MAGSDFGLMTYDPAFMNTASCKSTITFIDGDKGILEYRGYPIDWRRRATILVLISCCTARCPLRAVKRLDLEHHASHFHQQSIKEVMDGFHYNAHPMGMFISTLGCSRDFLS